MNIRSIDIHMGLASDENSTMFRTQAKKIAIQMSCDFLVKVVTLSIMKNPRTRIFLC